MASGRARLGTNRGPAPPVQSAGVAPGLGTHEYDAHTSTSVRFIPWGGVGSWGWFACRLSLAVYRNATGRPLRGRHLSRIMQGIVLVFAGGMRERVAQYIHMPTSRTLRNKDLAASTSLGC